MKLLTGKIAHILYAIPFAMFGIFHLMSAKAMAGYIATFPAAEFLIYFSGIGMIAAAVSIIIGKFTKLAMLLLALELLLFILLIHVPGLGNENPQMAQMSMIGLLKDVALIGGSLMIAGAYDKKE